MQKTARQTLLRSAEHNQSVPVTKTMLSEQVVLDERLDKTVLISGTHF